MPENKSQRPLILITNDDGVAARGLHHLVECVADFAEVVVVAPDGPQSGKSSAITIGQPLRITRHDDYRGAKMYSVSGTPVDCVKLAMHTILGGRRPDLLLSGINHGSNSGNAILYSGTMGAVIEGCMLGIPSIGYSLLHHSMKADFAPTTQFIKHINERVLSEGLPEGICLNVNFPAQPDINGMKVVRAALGHWTEEYEDYTDPMGEPFYLLTGKYIVDDLDPETTDEYWLARDYATIVPVHPDQTAVNAIASVSEILL